MLTEKRNLLNMNYKELEEFILEIGMKKFNAKQIYKWLHEKTLRKIEDMTDISAQNRNLLYDKAFIPYFDLLKHQVSKKDKTEKFLFQLSDKETIETVLMRHKDRNTICVSSQVGCAVKCEFCATGMDGFTRDLTLDEIVNQVYTINSRLIKKDETVNNLVFMGMGEPMLNLDNVLEALDVLSSPTGLNISKRRINISTCGIVPGIERLVTEKIPVGLAISLHAATNAQRDQIIPINKKYPLEDLVTSLKFYQAHTNRRVTFEYILLDEFNVSIEDANNLAHLLKGIDHTLNLIPYNTVEGKDFKRPNEKKISKFYSYLKNTVKLNVTIREEKGSDIDGACGQLRQKQGRL